MGKLATCSELIPLDFTEFGTVGTGGGGGRSRNRHGAVSRLGIVFHDELHCFRRFSKVLSESAALFAPAGAALLL